MLNNQLFVRKDRLEAVQFTGTVQNSAEVIEWLHARGIRSEATSSGSTELVKGKIVRQSVKTLYIHLGATKSLPQNGWIVEDFDGRYLFLDENEFEVNFAPVIKTTPV